MQRESFRLSSNEEVSLFDYGENCWELDTEIHPGNAEQIDIRVGCSPGGEEGTNIVCDLQKKLLKIDFSRSTLDGSIRNTEFVRSGSEVNEQAAPFALRDGELLKLRIFFDRSILEVFANSRKCVTQRIYPVRPDSTGVSLRCHGGEAQAVKFDAWHMAPANPY